MNKREKYVRYNQLLAERLSLFLNTNADFVEKSIVDELVRECGTTVEEAFSYVLASALGLDTENNADHREIFTDYFGEMVHMLDAAKYRENSYYKSITVPSAKDGEWSFRREEYKPYEAFVCGDLKKTEDGRIVPQIGFFTESFSYPAVLQNGREWMLITPNEIETMRVAVDTAVGRVLTYGLGLGYFAYMVSLRENVSSVTVVERDENVIRLFERYILPSFEHKEKVRIVRGDAFDYAGKVTADNCDFVFCDIWHDPSDGIDMYLRMKSLEKPGIRYMYWIEDTIRCYLK